MVREATIIAQASISTSNNAFDYFLRILKYHKNVIDGGRFSSAVCGIFLVHNIEEGVKNNVEGVQAAEAATGHSMYFNTHSMLPPTTDELVYQSESLGWEVTLLAATIQNCCIAKEILHQLASPQQPPTYPYISPPKVLFLLIALHGTALRRSGKASLHGATPDTTDAGRRGKVCAIRAQKHQVLFGFVLRLNKFQFSLSGC
jgi:hypothetical protein